MSIYHDSNHYITNTCSCIDIYLCLLPERIWHKVFFIVGILGKRNVWVWVKICALLDNTGHRIGRYDAKPCKFLPSLPTYMSGDLAGHSLNQTWRSCAMLVNDSLPTQIWPNWSWGTIQLRIGHWPDDP